MSIVTPKLLYSDTTRSQIPVWEIISDNGKCIYYERVHRDGYRPIGILHSFQLAGTTVSVYNFVRGQSNNTIHVLKQKDGYVAPMSWYERYPVTTEASPQLRSHPVINYHDYDNHDVYEEPDYQSNRSQ